MQPAATQKCSKGSWPAHYLWGKKSSFIKASSGPRVTETHMKIHINYCEILVTTSFS